MRLTDAEIARADTMTVCGDLIRYTVVVRPYEAGRMVSVVDVDTGERVPWVEPTLLPSGGQIQPAIREILRWMDKLAAGGPMASKSRMRVGRKMSERTKEEGT